MKCECCGFDWPVGGLKDCPRSTPDRADKSLCELCANTYAGLFMDSLANHPELAILKTIAYIGNQLREDLQK